MRLLILFGAQAVGKMTVGQALARITPMKLFHNHMAIEPVLELFDDFNLRAILRLRDVIFEEFARSDRYGMIFTVQWALNVRDDWDYIAHVAGIFEQAGAQVDYCELIAPLDVRLQRNGTENRLREKPSKRNMGRSEWLIMNAEEKYRNVSEPGEIPFERYLRLENADLPPEEAAERIATFFGYERKEG